MFNSFARGDHCHFYRADHSSSRAKCGTARAKLSGEAGALIVPFAPGGPTDIKSRAIGEKLVQQWGQQIVVDNKGGAGGNIGAELTAKSAPDGYTVMIGHVGTHAINVALYPRISFDPVRDFTPITLIATLPLALVVHQSVPAKSVWYGILGPAGLHRAIVAKWSQEIARIVTLPDMLQRFVTQGIDLVSSTPEQFAQLIKVEVPRWKNVVKESGAKVD